MIFRLTVAAIIKNEGEYISEWIEYHRLLGVEHFFLFDNGSTDSTSEILATYIRYGLVTLVSWPIVPGQLSAYNFAAKIFGGLSDWMMFIDLDEFVFLTEKQTLVEFLSEFEAWDQLLIPFMFFGSSGHVSKPSGLVIENFVHRSEMIHDVVKSIVRPAAVVYTDTHMSITRERKTCNEHGHAIPERWRLEKPTGDRIRVNHYYIKSLEDWKRRVKRGEVDPTNTKSVEQFSSLDYSHPDSSMSRFWSPIRAALKTTKETISQPKSYAPWSSLSEITYMRPWLVASHQAARRIRSILCDTDALSKDDAQKIDADLNVDRALLNLPVEIVTPTLIDRIKTVSLVAFDAMNADLGALDLPFGAQSEPREFHPAYNFVLPPNEKDDAVLKIPLSRSGPGRNYVQLVLHCESIMSSRVLLHGVDTGARNFSGVRTLRFKAGLNICLLTLSHRSFSVAGLRLSFHGTSTPVSIITLRIAQFI